MPRPVNLKTKIFLDGSDLQETDHILELLGFLDGQTTNPSNFVKALKKERGAEELRFSKQELIAQYKQRVQEISSKIPEGSVSVEVYAAADTTAEEMVAEGREMFSWIPNAHVKLPTTHEGLKAAEMLVAEGIRVNMTLVFTQEQAAAVYAATRGAVRGQVFISPFIGRLVDRGLNGADLVKNIVNMYQSGDGHVEVLAASIRTAEQVEESIAIGADIVTSYFSAVEGWGLQGMPSNDVSSFVHPDLEPIPYQALSLEEPWDSYSIKHELTDKGLKQFQEDWNMLLL